MKKFLVIALLAAGCAGAPTSPSPSAPPPPGLGAFQVSLLGGSCASASPLPGWRNCRGTVSATINARNTSGYVSVFFNYPDAGAFYHGEVQVAVGSAPGQITMNITNEYVRAFPFPYDTTITFYDGSSRAGSAPVVGSRALHLEGN